jgi:NAD(P)-dependent dehydrogenase (short-subunit alcohol dehydrogenase family)
LSSELMPRGIRVNAVSPGPIDTPIFDKIGLTDENKEQAIQEVLGRSPTGRFGHPREIANAVVFLASSASAWTIGSEFIIDGGRLLGL